MESTSQPDSIIQRMDGRDRVDKGFAPILHTAQDRAIDETPIGMSRPRSGSKVKHIRVDHSCAREPAVTRHDDRSCEGIRMAAHIPTKTCYTE